MAVKQMCVLKSAAKMIDTAQAKGKDLAILNAQNVSITRTVEKEDRGSYLINYAYVKAEQELQ